VTTNPDLQACDPNPRDGEPFGDTWAALAWSAPETAISHEVYFDDNFDDVNRGTGAAFRGNQTSPYLVDGVDRGTGATPRGDRTSRYFIVGFPGRPYPHGLTPGTTYYWRIDEIQGDGRKHRGPVWSFTIVLPTTGDKKPKD
jgi:hypothetical protein